MNKRKLVCHKRSVDIGSGGGNTFVFSMFSSFIDVRTEFFRVSWVPEGGMLFFVKIVLFSLCSSAFVVYSVDLCITLALRGLSLPLGLLFSD